MNDDDLIRRGDAIAALKAANLPFGYGQAAHAITNVPTAQVTVKPLEWTEIQQGRYYEARVIGILYSIRLGSDGVVRWQAGYMGAWHEATSLEAAKAAAQADYEARILATLEAAPRVNETPKNEHDRADVLTTIPAPVAPSLRITGPNSDGEYWLHIKAGGRSGGVNLGGERGPICKQLLDAASETGAKE